MRHFLLFFVVVCQTWIFACDVCNMVEYSNRENTHFAGFLFRFRGFNGYKHLENRHSLVNTFRKEGRLDHEPTGMIVDKTDKDWERYFTYELRGNLTLKKKWNIQFLLPYQQHQVYYNRVFKPFRPVGDSLIQVNGFGDVVLGLDRIFLLEHNDIEFILRPGIAMKFPTGKSDVRINNQLLDPMIQLGTGSTDAMLRFNFIVTDLLKGFEMNSSYRYNGVGANGYRFGDRYNVQGNVFYNITTGGTSRVVPKTGLYFESAKKDRFEQQAVFFSGGRSLFYHLGCDVLVKKIAIQLAYQKPISEKLNGPVIGNAGRVMIGGFYNF